MSIALYGGLVREQLVDPGDFDAGWRDGRGRNNCEFQAQVGLGGHHWGFFPTADAEGSALVVSWGV